MSHPLNPKCKPFEPKGLSSVFAGTLPASQKSTLDSHGSSEQALFGDPSPDLDDVIIYDLSKADIVRNGPSESALEDLGDTETSTDGPQYGGYPVPPRPGFVGDEPLEGNNSGGSASTAPEGWHGYAPKPRYVRNMPSIPSTDSSQPSLHPNMRYAWSPVRRWVNKETESRKRWEDIRANMCNNGMITSPFVPSTYKAFLELKAESADANQRALQKNLDERERDITQASKIYGSEDVVVEESDPVPVEMDPRLVRMIREDNLTLVTGRYTIWCEACREFGHIDWPTPKEYSEAQKRLPLPHIQVLDDQFSRLALGPDPIPTFGPQVPRDLRKVADWAIVPMHDGLTTEEHIFLQDSTQELDLEDINGYSRQLIKDIDEQE
ncbi:hypothetical protein F4804DRAFT_354151 [Jackrogersella minutella]|nr:hypothetical protein F4804DRAFT_354151 [Jackrogersella minutella]